MPKEQNHLDSMKRLRAATLTELKTAITDLLERGEESNDELVIHAKRLDSLLGLFIGTLPHSYQCTLSTLEKTDI